MKTICSHCDHANDLGRLFCTECGAKLDLSSIGDDIEDNLEAEKRLSLLKLAWIPLVIILLVIAGLCLWPNLKPFGREVGSGRSSVIDQHIWRLLQIKTSATGTTIDTQRPIKEKDANAWLLDMPVGGGWMQVRFEEDNKLRLRVVCSKGPIPVLGGKANVPVVKYTYQLTAEPRNGRLVVTGAKWGHFPMIGPLKNIVVKLVTKRFVGKKRALEVYEHLSRLEIEDKSVSLQVTAP